MVGRFGDGVWLVELAPLSDPDLVPQAFASVLGVRETPGTTLLDALVGNLEPKNVLLVVDNCEHLIEECASLAEALLRRCPDLRILATSREALGVAGEPLFAVPPLSLPDPHRPPDVEGLPRYEASRLFEAEDVRRRHAEFYLALAEEAEPDLVEHGTLLERLGIKHDNFRTALGWALRTQAGTETAELGVRIAVTLGQRRFWAAYGLGEGLAWLERGLDRSDTLPEPLRAEALGHAGWIANVQGDYQKALRLLEENYAVSKELGDNRIVAASLIQLGHFLTMHGSEHERVETLREETEELLTWAPSTTR